MGCIPLLLILTLFGCSRQKHWESNLLFRDWYVVKPVAAGLGSVAYGTITNEGISPQILKQAAFGCAASAELHETIETSGRMRMQALPAITLAPGETVVFEPGHKHVMLGQLKVPGDEKCEATLTFEAVSIRFTVPVRERKK